MENTFLYDELDLEEITGEYLFSFFFFNLALFSSSGNLLISYPIWLKVEIHGRVTGVKLATFFFP